MMNKYYSGFSTKYHVTKNSMKNYISACFLVFFPALVYAQNPVPAPIQQKRILLTGGIVQIGDGKIIQNGAVGFENGKLSLVAAATVIRIDPSQYDTIIDISGKQVYPGLIALNTTLGINEIEAVRATNDMNETGTLNPSVRSLIAYNTDSKVIPTVRSNGVLLAQVVPTGGLVSGQSSVVALDAWNYEDAAYRIDEGVHINWPSMRKSKQLKDDADEKQQQRLDKEIDQLKRLLTDARAYSLQPIQSEKNIHLESLRGLFNGTKSLYVHCNFVKEIIAAAGLCNSLQIKMILVGGTDAMLVAPLLKTQKIPVIIIKTHRLPTRDDEAIDMPYNLPAQLRDAGIDFAIAVDEFWQVRNLSFNAGTAAGHGLTREEALQAITSAPAKILGIYNTTGSLEIGKDATLLVSSGDILDMKSSFVEMAFINGRSINLDNIQSQLNRKFRDKYGLE